MLDKLNKFSPLLVIALLLVNAYLVVAVHQVKGSADEASWQALNAYNNAGTAAARCSDCSGVRSKLDMVIAQCSSCSRCKYGSSTSSTPIRGGTFYQTYQETLLEDVALKLNVDLKGTRDTTERIAKEVGIGKPSGWRWVR